MLTGDSGRGKNFLADAAVCALPEEWYLSFEAASATAFYYAAELDPAFLKHKFIYPNEAEAVDTVVEFLRPMFSQARAKKFVTNKNSDGTHVFQEISVEGPITGVVPTTRNTLNRELQTRMLVVELEDYKGRIKQHTAALSKQFAPDFVADPHAGLVPKWRAALRSLTGVRKVVIPFGSHAAFNLDNEDIGHGARLWGNLLGLMCAHAWLEQRNREIREVNGTQAVVATAADYKAAYELLKDVGRRSVVNLGETHRKIVQAVYDLKQEEKDSHFASDNFSVREIAKKAEVSPGTVSKNRTFLVTSANLLYEDETTKRLSVANDADPSWWQEGDPMKGFPKPSEVAEWDTHPPDPGNNGNTETPAQKSDTYAEKPVSKLGNTQETPETPTQVEAVELNGNLPPGHASGNGYKLVTSENLHEYLEELESENGDEDPLAERRARREARRQRRAEELHINSPERFHELPADEQDGIRAWVRENVVRQREPLSSYSLKHVAEKALGFYVGNGEIKGAMLEAGYTPLNTHRERGINFYFQAGPQKVKE
jgi:hypothetical protein